MKKTILFIFSIFFICSFVNFTYAGSSPCYVNTADDDNYSTQQDAHDGYSTLGSLRGVAQTDVTTDCAINAEQHADGNTADAWILFFTPELCSMSGNNTNCENTVRKIKLDYSENDEVQPISFNVPNGKTVIVGNYTQKMIEDSDFQYETEGIVGTETGNYADFDDDGEIDETGHVVIDGSALPEGVSPFVDPEGLAVIRDTAVITNGVNSIFTDHIINGGAVYVCNGEIKEGFESGEFDLENDDWCNGTLNGSTASITPTLEIAGVMPIKIYCKDSDGDSYYKSSIPFMSYLSSPEDQGYVLCTESMKKGDCDDNDAFVNPGMSESCNGLDDNCNDEIDEGLSIIISVDADGDGYCGDETEEVACDAQTTANECISGDCDDTNASAYPGATEDSSMCEDGIDQDCDGSDLACDDDGGDDDDDPTTDDDGDGYTENDGDCDDADATIYPGAEELCDGIDNDCDGISEGIQGVDADGNDTWVLLTDTDGDGLSDVAEITFWYTDEQVADTDGDDVSDGDEIMQIMEQCMSVNETLAGQFPITVVNDDNSCGTPNLDIAYFDGSDAVQCTATTESCTDTLDNDHDGFVDCADVDCYGVVLDEETGDFCPDLNLSTSDSYNEASSGCGCNIYAAAPASGMLGQMIMILFSIGLVGIIRFKK